MIHFITFANKDFMDNTRITEQAKDFGLFDTINSKNEDDIKDFVEKHKNFILNNKKGFGYYIWKSYIVLQELYKINYDDILVYSDAGMYINKNGKERFLEYINYIKDEKHICVFNTGDNYKAQYFVKQDAIMHYNPEFNSTLDTMSYSGLLFIRKTDESIRLIKDWFNLCENYKFSDKSISTKYQEKNYYRGNDCDNGLLCLVLSKYKDIIHYIYPDELNIYYNGLQAKHTGKKNDEIPWNLLDKIPFQYRRIRPDYY